MSARCIPFSDYASVRPARVAAVQAFGVTERQARFLTHVLVFSGVFLERQYCQFAGIVHGQKSHDFVARLIRRGFVTPITPGSVRRGRLYHVQFKPLYEAIGEPDNRHRKPATLGRLIARLMVLDAVLADDRYYWLGTERDKVHYFDTALDSPPRKETYPLVSYGTGGDAVRRFFPHKLPIGVEKDGFRRHVFLYLVTGALPWQFRQFLLDHAQTLMACPQWTLRLLMPRRLTTAKAVHRAAFLDQCTRPLDPSLATWLGEYFAECQRTGRHLSAPEDRYLAKAFRQSGATRVRALYRAWQRQGMEALWTAPSPYLRDAVDRRDGRLEYQDLPHQYLQCAGLIGQRPGARRGDKCETSEVGPPSATGVGGEAPPPQVAP